MVTIGAHLKQHTLGHLLCPACDEVRTMALRALTPDLAFESAAQIFIQLRTLETAPGLGARYARRNTIKAYERQKKSLELFFGGMPLREIHWWNLRAYQEARLAGKDPFVRYRRPQDAKPGKDGRPPKGMSPCPAKPGQVNHEVGFLKRLKALAGCWSAEDDKYYCPLQRDQNEVQRSLTPEEQSLWIDACRARDRWNVILWYSVVAFDTCASVGELRQLRLPDVNLRHQLLNVPWPASKNRFRHREIVLESADTLWALEQLLRRAWEMGARDPQHYLFPFRNRRGESDPTKAASESFLKKLWQEVRDASGLKWFRSADTRHTGATRLAEAGVDVRIIMRRMGHCSPRMQEHYTHICEQAQRRWLRIAERPSLFGAPPIGTLPPKQPPAPARSWSPVGAGHEYFAVSRT